MALKQLGLVALMALSMGAFASAEQDYYTIGSMQVEEVKIDDLNQRVSQVIYSKSFDEVTTVPVTEQIGSVIQVGKDLVALGEEIYTLVNKGRPSIKNDYSPISVVPKVAGAAVEPMDMENWKMPIKKSFRVVYKNLYNLTVVDFTYSVITSYGGTYNGKGAYLDGTIVVPESTHVTFGFDFTSTMKLTGIQNQGTKENPIATATLLIDHTVNSIMSAEHAVDSVVVNGKGYIAKIKGTRLQ